VLTSQKEAKEIEINSRSAIIKFINYTPRTPKDTVEQWDLRRSCIVDWSRCFPVESG